MENKSCVFGHIYGGKTFFGQPAYWLKKDVFELWSALNWKVMGTFPNFRDFLPWITTELIWTIGEVPSIKKNHTEPEKRLAQDLEIIVLKIGNDSRYYFLNWTAFRTANVFFGELAKQHITQTQDQYMYTVREGTYLYRTVAYLRNNPF